MFGGNYGGLMKKLVLCLAGFAASVFADEIQILDGTVLKGKISSISETSIKIETGFAGALEVDRTQVFSFSTDEPVFVRLASGAVMPGTVSASEQGAVEITGIDGTLRAPLSSVRQSWIEPGQDPQVLAHEQAVVDSQRKWTSQVAVNINGKSGNTDEQSIGMAFSATLASKEDELRFYANYDRKETDGDKSVDERKAGMRYTAYFNDPWGWYVRQEFERDEFENIKLRSVTAGGLSYRFADEDHYKLSANSGLSYRYESYQDGTPAEGSLGLDIGLQHFYRFKNRVEINNEFTWIPSIQDFASYLLTQNSWLDFPLGDSKLWKVRMGLRNDYNSQPAGGRKPTDTTYYSSLVVDWK